MIFVEANEWRHEYDPTIEVLYLYVDLVGIL